MLFNDGAGCRGVPRAGTIREELLIDFIAAYHAARHSFYARLTRATVLTASVLNEVLLTDSIGARGKGLK